MNSLISNISSMLSTGDTNGTGGQQQQQQQIQQQQQQLKDQTSNQQQAQLLKPKLKYKHWCGQVDKKCTVIQGLLPTLDSSLSSTDDKKKEKSTSSLQKINIHFQDLINLLETTVYKPSNKSPMENGGNSVENVNKNNSQSTTSTAIAQPPSSPILYQSTLSNSSDNAIVNNTTTPIDIQSPNNNNNTSSKGNSNVSVSTSPMSPMSPNSTSSSLMNNSSQKNTRIITANCRDSMLSLWSSILHFLEKFYKVDKDFSLFYHCILLICKRKEYDSSQVQIDPITFKPWSKASTDTLSKYKDKLYKTYYFIAMSISNNNYLSIPLVNFSSKFLALAYFRIPKIAKLIIESLTPPETEIKDIVSYYPTPPNLKHLSIIGERPDKSPFHSILMQIPDNFSLDTISQGWVDNLARKEMTFFIFFKEWFNNCRADSLDIRTVPGFYPITYALLHELKTRDQCSPPLTKPTPSMEAQFTLIQCCKQDVIIDTMVKVIFLKTCVFDLAAISSTLGLVEVWLKEFGVLPETFDIQFFCEGIESIIAADHHQVLLRALQMIYNCSDCFQGNNRKVLFQDLLLNKYFYHLFLHWDQPIRNAYHHLLLYRMVRIKRSILYESGFSIGEYSKLTHNNTTPVTKHTLSPTKFIEGKGSDHSYSSSSRLTTSTTSSIKPKSPRGPPPPSNPQPIASNSQHQQQQLSTSPPSSNTTKKVPPPLPPRNFLNSSGGASPTENGIDGQDQEISDITEDLNTTSLDDKSHEQQTQNSVNRQEQTRSKVIIPASLEKFSKDFQIDVELFLEIEIYIKKVSDQFRQPELKHHESRLSHYVASSLSEFKTYIAHNNQVDVTPPKIIPLMFANSPLNLANINANFRD